MAGSLRVRDREKSHMVRETSLCGEGMEFKTLKGRRGISGRGLNASFYWEHILRAPFRACE